MVASYRLALPSLCIIAAIAFASASDPDSLRSDAVAGRNSVAYQATRPQAVQLASNAMAADMRKQDSGSAPRHTQPAAAVAKSAQPAAAPSTAKQQQQQQPAQIIPTPSPVNPSLPGIPLSFYGDTMGRLTKDIRGVYLDLEPQRLLVTMRENGVATAPPSAFTYA